MYLLHNLVLYEEGGKVYADNTDKAKEQEGVGKMLSYADEGGSRV